jgi:hypothetical protein
MSTSPVAVEFAKRIAPRLVVEIEERKEALIAGAGSWPVRQAARLAFPAALKAVQPLTESGADAMLDEFGSLTLADVAGRLIAHQTAKGRRVHASFYERHDS